MAEPVLGRAVRLRNAMSRYDGDACRPEYGLDPKDVARSALEAHVDIAACYCPLCVLARVVLYGDKGNRMDASYVLDWLRQTEAPSGIATMQGKVVDAAGGYVGVEERIAMNLHPRSLVDAG